MNNEADDALFLKLYGQAIATLVKETVLAMPKAALQLKSDFDSKTGHIMESYLYNTSKRQYYIKTLIHDMVAVPLSSIFVNPDLSIDKRTLTNAKLEDVLEDSEGRPVFFKGTAGSGKSTMMRFYFINYLDHYKAFPVFITLRDSNSGYTDIYSLILDSINQFSDDDLELRQLKLLIKHCPMTFFFDGLDEVEISIREKVTKELIAFSNRHSNRQVFLSSRSGEYASFDNFVCYDVLPLSKESAIQLIKCIGIDQEVTDKFVSVLDKRLFHTHQSFSSNPLLLTLMLLMFDRDAEIPSSWSAFFRDAFNTLFSRHDARKPGTFKRSSLTGFTYDQFVIVFSAFSILSFPKGGINHSESETDELCQKALQLAGMPGLGSELRIDLQNHLCVITEESLRYRYVHKAFLEYFSAVYIDRLPDLDKKCALIARLGTRVRDEIFLSTMLDLNWLLSFDQIILPWIDEIETELGAPLQSEKAKLAIAKITQPSLGYITWDPNKKNTADNTRLAFVPQWNQLMDSIESLYSVFRGRNIIEEPHINIVPDELFETAKKIAESSPKVHLPYNKLPVKFRKKVALTAPGAGGYIEPLSSLRDYYVSHKESSFNAIEDFLLQNSDS